MQHCTQKISGLAAGVRTILYVQAECCEHLFSYMSAAWLQVYAVALYVEAEKAASELAVRSRGGFFGDNRCAQWAA